MYIKDFRIVHKHGDNFEVEHTVENGCAVFSVDKVFKFVFVYTPSGLASSAIAGIVVGSVAVLGLGCFRLVNTSRTYFLYLDTVKPTGTIKNRNGTEITGSYTNQTFSYSATDSGSGISYLQYKKPGSSS